jgi:hypothetical protein
VQAVTLGEFFLKTTRGVAMSRTISLLEVALSEHLAGARDLRRARASIERFRAALDQIPDPEPEPYD